MIQNHLRHVVLFGFKAGTAPEAIETIAAAFARLPEQIDGISHFEWGENVSPEGLDRGLTHCFLLHFVSEAARDAYLVHPAHIAFGKLLEPHLEKVCVIDYQPQE